MTDTIHSVTLTPQGHAAYTSGWNRAIEAAAKEAEATLAYGTKHAIPSCIRALSMPAPAQSWRVKPLEWHADPYNEGDYCFFRAKAGDYCYEVGANLTWWWQEDGAANLPATDGFRCSDDAQAAAQADYAARILAALIPDTEDDGA